MRRKAKVKTKDDPFVALVRRCDQENPKPADIKRMQDHLDQDDALVRFNESSEQVFNRIIGTITKSALSKELFRRQRTAKREDLDYESANAIVKVLIDQVIICHIRLSTFESWHAERMQESIPIPYGIYIDKMLSNYQRRFQKACESLAKVRKILSEADLAEQKARRAYFEAA